MGVKCTWKLGLLANHLRYEGGLVCDVVVHDLERRAESLGAEAWRVVVDTDIGDYDRAEATHCEHRRNQFARRSGLSREHQTAAGSGVPNVIMRCSLTAPRPGQACRRTAALCREGSVTGLWVFYLDPPDQGIGHVCRRRRLRMSGTGLDTRAAVRRHACPGLSAERLHRMITFGMALPPAVCRSRLSPGPAKCH